MRAKRHPYRFILARAWMDPTLPSACSHPSFEWQAAPHIGFSPKVTNLGLVPPEEIERDAFEVDQDQFGIYVGAGGLIACVDADWALDGVSVRAAEANGD
uniref:Uncharacterized protein n=1 Tax=Haptolina ericina TaxID=156174 RepID=A0A7S3EWX5_9EUKA|mmetsp:Transcript_3245/g.7059  ORF Transcript_3245/g.7059 Transcript_3245/m.7059 type:complete len:100 (+) Transcript_3245:493-792(+)